LRGAFLDAADSREQALDLLAAQITDPTSVQFAYQEVIDMTDDAQKAIAALLRVKGEMVEAQFARDYGSIRQMGPAKLEREMPWLYPESVAELLYYYGFIGRGFKGAGQRAQTIIYLAADIVPWLPHPEDEVRGDLLPIQPVPPPHCSRILPADDSFLEDLGSLLGFIHTEQLRITPNGPHPEDIDLFVQRLQMPFGAETPDLNIRLALLLHVAKRLGWLRRTDDDIVQLNGSRVRLFLEKNRHEQRLALWDAWLNSPEWNDLYHTPTLDCTDTGAWRNDPLQSRAALTALFARLQPGLWYSQFDFVEAVKQVEPDFQRPTGNYDTWYIRNTDTQEFLKGFEQWDAVEGELLRFLIRGPLHWLALLDIAEPSAGDDLLIALNERAASWLGQTPSSLPDQPRHTITAGEDFTLVLSPGISLADRFRIERFAQWKASYPHYVYQINQRMLKRAKEEGISGVQILQFLTARGVPIPPKVQNALQRQG
ncbi:MAG: hypothetical protein KDE47_12960, partial [Caldilineaceae bacterium]|nr:hypothetical protein [Caldilineaceae bacterium]